MNRRQALTSLAVLPGVLISEAHGGQQGRAVPGQIPKTRAAHVYLDQSGVFGAGGFTLGMLVVSDPRKLSDKIALFRRKHHFRCQLRYRSRNKWKLPYAKDLINYCLTSGNVRVALRCIVDTTKGKAEPRSERDERYVKHNAQLLAKVPGAQRDVAITTQSRYPKAKNSELIALLRQRQPRIIEIALKREDEDDALQLLGVIVGSFQASKSFDVGPTKMDLISFLGKKLGTGDDLWQDVSQRAVSVEILQRG